MSVCLDLTAITPELFDAVICMDNSPAFAAFREEIEAIIEDFNETGKLPIATKINASDLTAKSENTLKNMHKAFLIWSYSEEKKNGKDPDCCCHTLGKLFFKSQQQRITALNGGETRFDTRNARALIESYKNVLNTDEAVFTEVKDYFRGYVYGYFFNYLKEITIMKKYAEMLVYLGVMSGKVTATVSEQQKILPKMALLLPNDRFKYINGFVPTELTLDIVYDRINFGTMSAEEAATVKQRIKDYILANWKTDREDNVELISDDVTASFSSTYFAEYVSVAAFSEDLYNKSFSGTRIFLDCDRDDTGDYSAAKIAELTGNKCSLDHNIFYNSNREACLDTGIHGEEQCYAYPIIFLDGDDYCYSIVYEEFIYPVLDRDIFVPANIPSGTFPFADELFATNQIRTAAGITDTTITVRRDRLAVLEQLKRLAADTIMSDRDREMLMLEQILCLVSGNCDAEKYRRMVVENVFNSEIYGIYMRYRAELLAGGNLMNFETKKALLDRFNKASI